LKPDVLKVIDIIRTKIPSGADVDGYNAVIGRNGSKQNSFGKSSSGATHSGGGGGGSRFAVLHSGPRQAKPEPTATARGPNQAHSGRHYGPAITVPASSPKSSGGGPGATWGSSKPSSTATHSPSYTGGGGGGARYVPLFDKGKTSKEIILDKQVRDYLNKFCEERYDLTLRQFTNFMEGDNSELLSSFMTMFFDTAVSDAIQAPHLAKLLSELCVKFPYLQTEVNKRYAEFMATFETVTETEVSSDDLDAMDKEYHTTKYRLGYTQFITELLPYKITNDDDFYMILNRLKDDLITNYKLPNKSRLIESYASSWAIITTSLVRPANEKILSTIRNKIKTEIKPLIIPLTSKDISKTYPSVTSKARFALLDAMERLK
jgi:hypothetical protein